jgi:molybdate transport system substrate-binding protein
VIVVFTDSRLKIASPEDLASPLVKHVALADPKAVPAGVYSKEFLQKRKLWTAIEGKAKTSAPCWRRLNPAMSRPVSG